MVKILLVNPQVEIGRKIKKTRAFVAPLGLVSIGSYLINKGYSVELINAVIEDDIMEKITKKAKDAKYVGLSVMTAQIPHALMISDELKKKDKIIIWGGIHPELFKEQTCEDPSVDYVVYGEGEKTFFELVDALENGKKLEGIKGLVYKKDGKIIVNPLREPLPVEEIPDPNYDLLDLKKKFQAKPRMLEFETSRGCPYRCGFCIDTVGWRHKWRALPAEKVLCFLESIKEKYAIEYVVFREENFAIDKARVGKIIDGMIEKKLNLKWSTNIRADCFREDYINDEFMSKLKDSGMDVVYIGVESGSEKIRSYMNKGITDEQVFRVVELCKKYDVKCKLGFMVGYPTETRKDIYDTISMINRIIKINPDAVIDGPVPFRPYPGASIYDVCLKYGLKEPKSLREWGKDSDFSAYLKVGGFPWVDNKDYSIVENLGKYSTLATSSWKRIISYSPLLVFPALLCRLRWKLKFFRFPYDYKLYKWITNKLPVY